MRGVRGWLGVRVRPARGPRPEEFQTRIAVRLEPTPKVIGCWAVLALILVGLVVAGVWVVL